jgi:hypothetical protein
LERDQTIDNGTREVENLKRQLAQYQDGAPAAPRREIDQLTKVANDLTARNAALEREVAGYARDKLALQDEIAQLRQQARAKGATVNAEATRAQALMHNAAYPLARASPVPRRPGGQLLLEQRPAAGQQVEEATELWWKPSTWTTSDDVADYVNQLLTRRGMYSVFTDEVRVAITRLEQWAAAADDMGDAWLGSAHADLGDSLFTVLRTAFYVSRGVPRADIAYLNRRDEFSDDPLGKYCEEYVESSRGGRGGRGRAGRGRGGRGGGGGRGGRGRATAGGSTVCNACSKTGHFARDCPDANKRATYMVAKNVRGGRNDDSE